MSLLSSQYPQSLVQLTLLVLEMEKSELKSELARKIRSKYFELFIAFGFGKNTVPFWDFIV
jgi:hypothetical protein